jgi:hypothetical protein
MLAGKVFRGFFVFDDEKMLHHHVDWGESENFFES